MSLKKRGKYVLDNKVNKKVVTNLILLLAIVVVVCLVGSIFAIAN